MTPGPASGSAVGLLVLLRHGQSRSNFEERFTGWQDAGLTGEGREGALHAARLLVEAGITFDLAFVSRLGRATATLRIVLEAMGLKGLPVRASWRLNERHYGALQGMEKDEATEVYGEERVRSWRRDYRSRPPAIKHREGHRDGDLSDAGEGPATESLEEVAKRVLPYWAGVISAAVEGGGRALVVAHGNSLRALVKHLDGLSEEEVEKLEIPPATPLVYELDAGARPTRRYRLGPEG